MSGDMYGYEPTAPPAPSPKRASSPAVAPNPGLAPSPARYVYLIGRLRGRQITMEEATELFQIQQQMIARAQAMSAAPTHPPPPSVPAARSPAPTSPAPPGASEDLLWESFPALAAGAGILAAVLKRAQEGPKPDPPSAPSSSPAPAGRPAKGSSSSR